MESMREKEVWLNHGQSGDFNIIECSECLHRYIIRGNGIKIEDCQSGWKCSNLTITRSQILNQADIHQVYLIHLTWYPSWYKIPYALVWKVMCQRYHQVNRWRHWCRIWVANWIMKKQELNLFFFCKLVTLLNILTMLTEWKHNY